MLGPAKVIYVAHGAAANANCPGSAFEPKAEAGYLCIYEQESREAVFEPVAFLPGGAQGAEGVASSGTIVDIKTTGESGLDFGTWAVTAP